MSFPFNTKTAPIILILISIILAIISINILPSFPFSDEAKYDELALHITTYNEYKIVDNQIISPGYPIFLASIYKIFGHNYSIVYFIQFLLIGLTSILIYLISHKFLNISKKLSLVTSFVTIFWPYMILYASLLRSEILFIFFIFSSIYLLLKFINQPTKKTAIILGIIISLTILIRPVVILLPIWIVLFLLTPSLKININKKYITTILITIGLMILPWIIYSSNMSKKINIVASNYESVTQKAFKTLTYEYDIYKTKGYEPDSKITLNKIIISKLKNIYRFWNPGASGYQADILVSKYPDTKYFIYLYKLIFFIILIISLLSLIKKRRNKNIIILWLVVIYFWAVYSLLFTYPRYTLPIIPIIFLLASYSIYHKQYKIF